MKLSQADLRLSGDEWDLIAIALRAKASSDKLAAGCVYGADRIKFRERAQRNIALVEKIEQAIELERIGQR